MLSPDHAAALREGERSRSNGWLRALDAGDGTLALLLLAPAALSLAAIIVYPVCRLIYTSFFSLSLERTQSAVQPSREHGMLHTEPGTESTLPSCQIH